MKLLALIFVCGALAGCESLDLYNEGSASEGLHEGNTEVVDAQDFGNGVYYFPVNQAIFARSIAKFKADHPELIITAVAGNGSRGYGQDEGYYVITEPRDKHCVEASPNTDSR